VRAVGTVFDVYRKRGSSVVTVIEGVVVVEHTGKDEPAMGLAPGTEPSDAQGERPFAPVNLAAGKQAIVKPGEGVEASQVNVAAAIAWTHRELVFEFTSLSDAAEEFNRYNDRKLVIQGQSLRAFKISAIFRSTDPRSLVHFVEAMPAVHVRETEHEIVISGSP
jgi:transmembrane sensor